MEVDLSGASAIVTGGGSGLGAATARALARAGAGVVVVDRDGDLAEKTASGVGGVAVVADVAVREEVGRAVDAASAIGPLRVLVNCAGIAAASRIVSRSGEAASIELFDRVVRVNLIGTFNCIAVAATAMAATDPLPSGERGSIVNTASVAAFEGQIGQAAYSASKGGIVSMTLPLARELATHGIRVNTIAPGLFETAIYGDGPEAEELKRRLCENIVYPKRLGVPDEFADVVLAIMGSSYLNGETVRLDAAVRLPPR